MCDRSRISKHRVSQCAAPCGLRSGQWRPDPSGTRLPHLLCFLRRMAPKPVTSPVPVQWYPALSALLLVGGLFFTAFFFIYEATSSTRNRSLAKEVVIAAVASTFLGFGSLFLLLATGVYV
ncbi:unnamed protein product [Musa hybrid cultivar]